MNRTISWIFIILGIIIGLYDFNIYYNYNDVVLEYIKRNPNYCNDTITNNIYKISGCSFEVKELNTLETQINIKFSPNSKKQIAEEKVDRVILMLTFFTAACIIISSLLY